MNWYLSVLKKYAEFNGRARRKEYWMFALFNFLIIVGLVLVESLLGLGGKDGGGILSSLYILAIAVPGIAVTVRRLHDIGKSGWWLLLGLVPLVGFVLFVFALIEGNRGPNQYGEDPKNLPTPI